MASSNTRTLVLPHGGSMEIPLPGSDARFTVKAPSVLAAAEMCPNLVPTIAIGLVLGIALGIAGTAVYLHYRK